MRKLLAILILIGITHATNAQNPAEMACNDIRAKLAGYDDDDMTTFEIEQLLDAFAEGDVFDSDIVETKYAGLVYILSDDDDCIDNWCSKPAVAPAVWFGTDRGISMMGLRSSGSSKSKRPLSKYVRSYYRRISIFDESATQYIIRTDFSPGLSPYHEEDNSYKIDDEGTHYARKNGDYIIGLSLSEDKSDMMIYFFDVAGQAKLLRSFDRAESASTPPTPQYSAETKEKIAELEAMEKDRNVFSEMIEAIVNHPELAPYYHNRQMFILTSGLFRYDLEIKYQNKDMLSVVTPLDGITDYISFTHYTYDGETDHPVEFDFNIPKEGVFGRATFNYDNEEWILDSMQIVEN